MDCWEDPVLSGTDLTNNPSHLAAPKILAAHLECLALFAACGANDGDGMFVGVLHR